MNVTIDDIRFSAMNSLNITVFDDQNTSHGDGNWTGHDEEHANVYGRLIMNLVYCLIFVIGVLGNVWVFFLVGRNRQTKAVTNIFIVNLAIADLFLMLFLPIIVANSVISEWIFGMFMCKLYFTCDGINKFASIMFLVLLSIDRYLAVCHPVASRSVRTIRVAFAMVAASWIIVIALMTPVFLYATLMLNVHDGENYSTIQCSIYWSNDEKVADRIRRTFTFYTFSISYLVPLLLIWSFYLLILNRLRRQEKLFNYSSSGTSSNANGRNSMTLCRRRRSSRRISIMVLTIVISYTICWMPYWIVQVSLELFPEGVNSLGESFTIFSLLAYGFQYMNSAINPFLYAFGTGSFRHECFGSAIFCFTDKNAPNDYHLHDSPSSCSSMRTTKNHHIRKETKLVNLHLKDQENLLRNYFSNSKHSNSSSQKKLVDQNGLTLCDDTKETHLITA